MSLAISDLHASQRNAFLGLLQEVYGQAMSEAQYDWFFERNPAGRAIGSVAYDSEGVVGVVAMSPARALVARRDQLVMFAVHGATHPRSRGQGVFSTLELRNEKLAGEGGAAVALGFTNALAGPILVGKLGWRDLYRMRLWVRLLHPLSALRRRPVGGLPPPRARPLERFTAAQTAAWKGVHARWESALVRDPAYLNWRYVDAPQEYRVFASANGYAVVGYAVKKGFSAGVICDLVGPSGEQRALLRRCLSEARGTADLAVGVPGPGQRAAYLSVGFVPSPQTIRVIGKPLSEGASLPKRWHFSLGDTDIF